MSYLIGTTAEVSFILLLGLVQWRLVRDLYRYFSRRASAVPARLIRAAMNAALAIVLTGLIFSLPNVSHMGFKPGFIGWLRGASLMWAFSSSAAWVLYRLVQLVPRRPDTPDPGRRALLRAASAGAAAVPFACIGFGTFIERTAFRVREIDVPVPDLHKDLEGLRLVQLSDIHLSPFLSESEFARAVDAANELKPHAMLVTGDLISMRGDPLDACLRQLARLRSDVGTLGCLGNHEIYAHTEQYTTQQGARLGMDFLRQRSRQLRFGAATVNIGGLDYQRMDWRSHYLNGAERLIERGSLNILLEHNPDVFPAAARQGWDLTISGHTHGGQVNVEILDTNWNVARFYTPFIYGLYSAGRSSMYVTRGIGTIGMPTRLGAPPEISALRLRKA